MKRDLRKDLDNAPDEGGGIWKPNVGDELIGVVRSRDTVTSKFSDTPQPHLIVQSDDGPVLHVYGRHTLLVRRIEDLDPQPGDRVAIRRTPGVPGKNYHVYKMVVDKLRDDDLGF